MTAPKHSAPPWKLKTGMGGPQAITKQRPGEVEAFICLFLRNGGISTEESLANARLIEKAPDLFRCLEDLNNALYRVESDPEGVLRINHDVTKPLAVLLGDLEEQS
jgi:hypothetical protein